MKVQEELRIAFAKLSPQDFEDVCCRLLQLHSSEYEGVNSNRDAIGKTRKGTPDGYVRESDGRYIAIQFTTQQQNIKAKVLKDISDLTTEKCHFRNKISKVTICITTNPSSEIELFYQACEKNGWRCHVLTLDDLVRVAENNPVFSRNYLNVYIAPKEDTKISERHYLCGDRVKEVREERKVATSMFIDVIDH